jgi:hypothetical protein
MRWMISIVTAFSLGVAMGQSPAAAATGDTYDAKKATCEKRANTMDFGIHFIKKSRWVKDCIAGKHPR